MKLLLDMGVSPRTAEFLRKLGHDADHLGQRGLPKATDEEIVRLAAAESRTVVTFDLDFTHILALQRLARPSLILFRLPQFTTLEINDRLRQLLSKYETQLTAGAVLVIELNRIRVRMLPIW